MDRTNILFEKFAKKLDVSDKIKVRIFIVVGELDEEHFKKVTNYCWFVEIAIWGFALPVGKLKKNDWIIVLNDRLKDLEKNKIDMIIAHEIGHVVLNHKIPVFDGINKQREKQQDEEAFKFAERLLGLRLSEVFKQKKIRKVKPNITYKF